MMRVSNVISHAMFDAEFGKRVAQTVGGALAAGVKEVARQGRVALCLIGGLGRDRDEPHLVANVHSVLSVGGAGSHVRAPQDQAAEVLRGGNR